MPPLRDTIGERMSSLETKVEGFERYEHERWHKLNNDLQPLVALPERITRDVAKMQGNFEGRINSVSKEIERSITAAIEKAIEPMSAEINRLRSEVDVLKLGQHQMTTARRLAVWALQTLIAAVSAIVAVFALGRHP